MNIYLSGLGWLIDPPAGNRLLWSYPLQALDGGGEFLGLPRTIIVERAFIYENIKDENLSLVAPYSWWNSQDDVLKEGVLPVTYRLPKSVQAVSFTYYGPTTMLRVYDSTSNLLVYELMISNSDQVSLKAPAIDRFEIFTIAPRIDDLMTLNLFVERSLNWKEIARINVADTVNFNLEQVKLRYGFPPKLTEKEWDEFVNIAMDGLVSNPKDLIKNEPSDWEAFSILLGLRWEYAVLFGHAFFDGPRTEFPTVDKLEENLLLKDLSDLPNDVTYIAYRVREEEKGRTKPSNVFVCPRGIIPPLAPPSQLKYEKPEVHLKIDTDTNTPEFMATYNLQWKQSDQNALGVQVVEETSSSPMLKSKPSTESFYSRTRFPEDLNFKDLDLKNRRLYNALIRSREVPFHDVRVRCCMQAIDGWDRVSEYSAWTPWTNLQFDHESLAPYFVSAQYSSGTARLTRQIGDPRFPDWEPDFVIKNDPAAKLLIYRRKEGLTGNPEIQSVEVSEPFWIEGSLYCARITDVTNLSDFLYGHLIVPPFKAMITAVSGEDIYFEVGNGTGTIFSAGYANLQQDPMNLKLWSAIAEFDPHNLPVELGFSDPMPDPTDKSDILSYHARLSCLGKLGPASNVVHAIRIPPTPNVPLAFTVESLGIDFYNRTLVKIQFINPVNGGFYTIWWANGALTPIQFDENAIPGEQLAQPPYKNQYLFDVLPIPLSQTADRTITIGVQQVNEGGGQSAFKIAHLVLPALVPD